MENIKYIDITQLPEDLWQDAKNIIALDANGEVIKAEKEDSYSKEEIDELLSNTEVSADNLKDKIKINSASTDYVVTQPTVSGDNLVITDAMSDKNKYHTFGFDKTYSTTSYGLLNYKTPLFRGTNEYNCPQWDGNTVEYDYTVGSECYLELVIPYVLTNGQKCLSIVEVNIYRENVVIENSYRTTDDEFPNYMIIPFQDSDVFNFYGADSVLRVEINGYPQSYSSSLMSNSPYFGSVIEGQTVKVTLGDFPLEFSYGSVEGTIETPRFNISPNTVLYGDVPTENETSNAPERLNDYIRYENDEKAYILTDMNYQNVIKNKDVQINSASTDYVVTQPTVSGDNIIITDVVSDKNQLHTFGFDKTFSKEDWVYRTDFIFEEGGRNIFSCPDWNASDNTLTMSVNSESYGQFRFTYGYFNNGILSTGAILDITISEGSITLSKNAEYPNPSGSFAGNYNNILKVNVDGTYISYFPNVYTVGSVSKTFGDNSKIVFTLGKIGSFGLTIPPSIRTTGEQNILQAPETVTAQTSDYPERLNDYIRYSNDVKSYILTDKNYSSVIKEWVGTQEEYDALETIDNNTTYYITE